MAILCLATGVARPQGAPRAHRRRLPRRRLAGDAPRSQARSARWRRCCATRSSRTSCRRSRACRRSSTAGRSRTSPTAPTRSPPRALALAYADVVVTEAGLRVRARRREVLRHQLPLRRLRAELHGAGRDAARAQDARRRAARARSRSPTCAAVERGLANLEKHVENIRKFEQPCVVAINHFPTDTAEEIEVVRRRCAALGVEAVVAQAVLGGRRRAASSWRRWRGRSRSGASRDVPAALRLERRRSRRRSTRSPARCTAPRRWTTRPRAKRDRVAAREARLRQAAGLHRQDAAVAVGQSRRCSAGRRTSS